MLLFLDRKRLIKQVEFQIFMACRVKQTFGSYGSNFFQVEVGFPEKNQQRLGFSFIWSPRSFLGDVYYCGRSSFTQILVDSSKNLRQS